MLREVRVEPGDEDDTEDDGGHPFDLAAVAGLPLSLTERVTVLVGENGAGKSTLLEAIAVRAGFNPEGGSGHVRFEGTPTHSPLHERLVLSWSDRLPLGWFLRAESFYNVATFRQENRGPVWERSYHEMSHGESFIDVAATWFERPAFFVLDEPEAGLSFTSQLALIDAVLRGVAGGAQFVLATHSPVLMAIPGADIVEVSEAGLDRCPYDDLAPVALWRDFLDDRGLFLRHLGPDADADP